MRTRIVAVVMAGAMAFALVAAGSVSAAPVGEPASATEVWHVVQWRETLWRISRQYGVTVQAIAQANGLADPSRIRVGQRLLIPTAAAPVCGYQIHVVRRGDTLFSISVRYGVSVWTLARANRIANPNLIQVGQRLIITKTGISIATPAAGAVLDGSVRVSGTGSGFENTVVVDVRSASGTVLGRKAAIVSADVGQVGPYAVDVTFTKPATTQPGKIVVWRENAADGSVAEQTCVDVVLKGSSG